MRRFFYYSHIYLLVIFTGSYKNQYRVYSNQLNPLNTRTQFQRASKS